MAPDNTNQQGIEKSKSIIASLLMMILIAFLSVITYLKIPSNYEIRKDAKENTTASYYLWDKGFISNDGVTLSKFREPLPIAVLATHMALFTDVPIGLATTDTITQTPHYIHQVNLVNLYYIIPSFFVMWWLCYMLTRSHLLSAIFIYLSWGAFYFRLWYLGRPLTEYAASLFILIIAAMSLKVSHASTQKQTIIYSTLLGFTLGLLALTKAAGLYVGIAFIAIFALYRIILNNKSLKSIAISTILILLGLICVVTPWAIRNATMTEGALSSKGTLIAGRGGDVLLGRVKQNEKIAADPIGAAYAFAPILLQEKLFEQKLGYSNKDLWEGGKYASLNRALTYLKNKDDTAIKAININKDAEHTKVATQKIVSNWSGHIISTMIFAWRGIWSFNGGNHLSPGGKTMLSIVFNLLSFTALLAMPITALIKRNSNWFVFSLFGTGFFWIYALFSHFIPRYSAPLIPLAIISFLLIANNIFQIFWQKIKA